MTPVAHHATCHDCGGRRTGHAWGTRGQNTSVPLCAGCKAARKQPGARCPKRCGPGGIVGPRCRYYLRNHPTACQPAGCGPQRHVEDLVPPEAVHA